MADDIVNLLANMATNHGKYSTHYDGCHVYHLECAALMVCDEIERRRDTEMSGTGKGTGMTNDERPPFGHPDFYAPISHMLRDAAEDADCHAYTDELLFAADEIERLRAAGDALHDAIRSHNLTEAHLKTWEEARRG